MKLPVLSVILFAWPAFAYHVGLNQSGLEIGKKWERGFEVNIFSNASFRHHAKPVDNIFEIGIGINGAIRVFQAYSTDLKLGSAFEYRVLKFSGDISSEKDVFVNTRILYMAMEYAANEILSFTFDSALYALDFDRKFEYSGYYLGGIKPRIGIRFNI